MSKILFKKGDFITQDSVTESFAIWDGTHYKSKEGEDQYALIVYGNIVKDETTNKYKFVTHIGCNGKSCGYVIEAKDMDSWRKCTQNEINIILLSLFKNKYKWNNTLKEIEKLTSKDTLSSNDSSSCYKQSVILKKRSYQQKIKIKPMDVNASNFIKLESDKYNEMINDYHPKVKSPKKIKKHKFFNSYMSGLNRYGINFLY